MRKAIFSCMAERKWPFHASRLFDSETLALPVGKAFRPLVTYLWFSRSEA